MSVTIRHQTLRAITEAMESHECQKTFWCTSESVIEKDLGFICCGCDETHAIVGS